MLMVVWNPSADDDRLQVQLPRQFLARFIETLSNLHPAVFRMHHYFDAIHIVTVLVMVRYIPAVCNIVPSMAVIVFVKIDQQTRTGTNYFSVQFCDQLSLRENAKMAS